MSPLATSAPAISSPGRLTRRPGRISLPVTWSLPGNCCASGRSPPRATWAGWAPGRAEPLLCERRTPAANDRTLPRILKAGGRKLTMSSTRAGSRAGRETGDSARRYVSRDGDYLLAPVDGDRVLRQLAWGTAPGAYPCLIIPPQPPDRPPRETGCHRPRRSA